MKNKDQNKTTISSAGSPNVKELLKVLKKWNWGAFFLTFIWGLGNRVWWSLLMFLPIFPLQLILPFILGAKGNLSAWLKKKNTDNLEIFKARQKKWNIAGGVVGAIVILFLLVGGFQVGKSIYGFGNSLYKAFIIGGSSAQMGAGIDIIKEKTGKYPKTMTEVLNSEDPDVKAQIGELNEIPTDITGEKLQYCVEKDNYYFVYNNNANFSGSETKFVKYDPTPKEGEASIVDITEEDLEKVNCVQE